MVTPESPTTHRAASQTRWRKPMVLASPTGAHAKTPTRRDPGAVTSLPLRVRATRRTYGVLRCRLMSKFVSFSYFALLSFNAVYSIQLYIAVHYTTSTTPLVSSWSPRGSSPSEAFCHSMSRHSHCVSKNTLHKYSVPRCGVRILLRAHQSHRLDSRSSLPA